MLLRAPRKWTAIAILLCLPVGSTLPPVAAAPVAVELDLVQRTLLRRTSPRFLVCGHRGSYFDRPNNSPKSIEKALRAGAELIELDIELTADHHCVLAHDAWPRAKSLAQWRAEGKGITTLKDAFHVIRKRAVVILDLKTYDVGAVSRTVRASAAQGYCVFYTPKYHELRKLDKTAYVMVRARNGSDVWAFARHPDKHIVMVHGDYKWLTSRLIQVIRQSGRRAFANSYKLDPFEERFGAQSSAARLFRRGIGVIQTNHVASAVAARRSFRRRR